MRSYGPRLDPDGVTTHARVASVATYRPPLMLWRRTVAGAGTITCELLRPNAPARRLVRLTAAYDEAGVGITRVIYVTSSEEEQAEAARLERIIRLAQLTPATSEATPGEPAGS